MFLMTYGFLAVTLLIYSLPASRAESASRCSCSAGAVYLKSWFRNDDANTLPATQSATVGSAGRLLHYLCRLRNPPHRNARLADANEGIVWKHQANRLVG